MSKIRVLYYGDAPTASTGFGVVTKNILTNLYKTGKYDITVLGVNYFPEPNPYQKMFDMWPLGFYGKGDPFGRQFSAEKMVQLEYDVIFMIQDSFIMNFMDSAIPQLRGYGKQFSTVMYYPIDGVPRDNWIRSMASADIPVTYTKFGYDESVKAYPGIQDKLLVVPHGVNTKDFFPLPKDKITDFRKQFFREHADKFIVTNVGRNQPRKDFPRTMMAFREFKKLRPNSFLYFHAAAVDMGWNIPEMAKSMGLRMNIDVAVPENFTTNSGYPTEIVNLIYNSSDVVVSSALGEGWGLTTTESMACKVPGIFPRNTAFTEIVGEDRGYLVNSGATINDWIMPTSDNEVLRPLIDITDMVDKLISVHDDREEAMKRAENGYKWINSTLQWDKHIVPQWDRILQKAASMKHANRSAPKSPTLVSGNDI